MIRLNTKKGWVAAFVFIVLAGFLLFNRDALMNRTVVSVSDNSEMVIGYVTETNYVLQQFIPKYDMLKSIRIKFATYGAENPDGDVKIELYDEALKLIEEREFKTNRLKDDEYYEIDFSREVMSGAVYFVKIYSYGNENSIQPTVWIGKNSVKENGDLYYGTNNKIEQYSLDIGYCYADRLNLWQLLVLIVFILLTEAFILTDIQIPEKYRIKLEAGVLLLMPFISFLTLEGFLNNGLKLNFLQVFLNLIWFCMIYLAVFLISHSFAVCAVLGGTLCCFIGCLNYYIVMFRGNPIVPWDIFSAGTALQVAGGYTFRVNTSILFSVVITAFMAVLGSKLQYRLSSFRKKCAATGIGIFACIVVLALFIGNISMFEKMGVRFDTWDKAAEYKKNGVLLSFMMNMKYLKAEKPEEYSIDKVEKEIAGISTVKEAGNGRKPNIIMIMNESFADLQYISKLNVNTEYMPYINSLDENTIKGKLYVSVFGGGTCNTEFEVLTGDSMAFLPSGTNPYQQYIRTPIENICTVLEKEGYRTVAMHPEEAKNWRRNTVYPLLGFREFYDISMFKDSEKIETRVTDKANYEKIIQLYEEKEDDEPLFLFNVTIQNHGGYTRYQSGNFEADVKLKEESEYPQAEEFLSLVKLSDEAVKELLDYFSKQEEPTVIAFFGDHLPSISDGIYDKLMSETSADGLEKTQRRYMTPYFIWANYEIEEELQEELSANYLGVMVLDAAGIELPPYYQYLNELKEEIPVINVNGYMDKNRKHYSFFEDTHYSENIAAYEIMQYNHLFDIKNTVIFD